VGVDGERIMVYNGIKINRYQTNRMDEKYTTSVRMPVALAERVRWQAGQEHRSINGMIIHLLTQALEAYPTPAEASTLFPDSESGGSSELASEDSLSTSEVTEH
jgi:hypothetical protein